MTRHIEAVLGVADQVTAVIILEITAKNAYSIQ
jgi:hypothetical protein